ncbi:MAG: molecular chaperone DnaJ [Deltaproteobacteria bacterium]|nr:molecular chaperone DnaJ [Deltaproteobacteria bacterium]
MQEKDLYNTLGVDRSASATEIKKAFRKLALKHHPDKAPGDKAAEEQFKEMNEAYEVLKDPEKKARYDRFGYAAVSGAAGGGAPGPGGPGFNGDFQDFFGDLFSDFFGGRGGGQGRRRPGAEQGRDLRYDIHITFKEAAFGTTKDIEIPRSTLCKTCKGSRAKPGTTAKSCGECNGHGQYRVQQGLFAVTRECHACHGAGTIIASPCTDCRGRGSTERTNSLTITIPPGVDNGNRLRVSGEGDSGVRGGPHGDLYVFITVEEHPIFKRDGDDIICMVPISFPQAALGCEIEAPIIEGTTKLKIPKGTQNDKVMRIHGKGIASLRGGRRGDHIVVIKVETPTKLNKRQRELLNEFAEISGDDVFPERKNFFKMVKDLFE